MIKKEEAIKKIPKDTIYCYTLNEKGRMNVCPYWEMLNEVDENGEYICYCKYLKSKSYVQDSGNLIWDMCKECGINDEWEEEENK